MAARARRQHGVVTRRQLLDAGFGYRAIDRRVQAGSLHPVLPGVYLVGHRAEPPLARECAAILYCAPRAMLSHGTAIRLWKLAKPVAANVEVTLVGRSRRPPPGLRVYTIGSVEPKEVRRRFGLPITSPSLTLLDYAGAVGQTALARAHNEARVQGLVSDEDLQASLAAHPNRRGARALRKLLATDDAAFVVESEAEALCLRLMIKYGLRPDTAGARVGPYRVDFLYRAERLVVEVDGYRYHSTRKRFVGDRRRTAELLALGYQVFPLSWADLVERPEESMRRLTRVLVARRAQLGVATFRA